MKTFSVLIAASALVLGGCSQWLDPPQSIGDVNSGYRYVPIQPLPLSFGSFGKCATPSTPNPDVLDALHNLSTRVATQQISGEGNVGLPIFSASASGSIYQVTQDFIAYDETPLRFEIPEEFITGERGLKAPPILRLLDEGREARAGYREITVPVYVGLGVRLTANVTVRRGSVNLADLGSMSAAAKAEQIRGGLVADAMGMKGVKISAILPLNGELNTTTIQNAAVAIGSIKALLHDPATGRWPQVVGIHYPFARVDPAMVNAIVSALASRRIHWTPCETAVSSLRAL